MSDLRDILKLLSVAAVLLLLAGLGRAATVHTLDGRSFAGELQFGAAGGLQIKTGGGPVENVPFNNLLQARLGEGAPPYLDHLLADDWRAQDFGIGRGISRQTNGTFTLYAGGSGTNHDAFHYLSRPLHTDGEIVARFDSLSVAGDTATAGLMMDEGFGVLGRHVGLTVRSDGKIRFFRRRDYSQHIAANLAAPTVTLPCWLRLTRRDNQCEAYFSQNGTNWFLAGKEGVGFASGRELIRAGGRSERIQHRVGLIAANSTWRNTSTAVAGQVRIKFYALQGDYFKDPDFKQPLLARLDPRIAFSWGHGSSDTNLGTNSFSVRWTGQLTPRVSTNYVFCRDGGEAAKLWINDELVPPNPFDGDPKKRLGAKQWLLKSNESYSVRLEFTKTNAQANMQLGWVSRGQGLDHISPSHLGFVPSLDVPPEKLRPVPLTMPPSGKGLLLRHGSFLAGDVTSADESSLKLAFAGRKDFSVGIYNSARLAVRPTVNPVPFEDSTNRAGVFLRFGDFFESEFKSINSGALKTSSVLFGIKNFPLNKQEVLAVVFNNITPAASPYEVRLADGSVLKVKSLTFKEGTVVVDDLTLGPLPLPLAEVAEIRNTAARP